MMDDEGSPKGDTNNDLKHPEIEGMYIGWMSHHSPYSPLDSTSKIPWPFFSHAFGPGKIWSGSFTHALDVIFDPFSCANFLLWTKRIRSMAKVFLGSLTVRSPLNSYSSPPKKEAGSSSIPIHFFFSDVLLLVFRKLILGVQPLKFPSAPKFAHAEFYQNDIRCLRSHTWNGWNAFVWLDFFWFEETLVNAPHHKVKLTLTPFLIEQMGWPPLTNMVNCQPRHDEASKLHSGKLNQQVRPPHENRPKLHQKGKVCIPLGLKSPLILTINIH